MKRPPHPARPEGCITDMSFDAWFADDLMASSRLELEQHLAGCVRCAERSSQLEQQRTRVVLAPLSLPAPTTQAKVKRLPVAVKSAAAAVALAAAALLAFLPAGRKATVAHKGSERLGFFVKRGELVTRGVSGQRVAPGDLLRFTYSTPEPSYLTILSLDGAGQASVYFPDSDRALKLPARQDGALPTAVELDSVLGQERVIALFCDAAVDTESLRQQLQQQGPAFTPPLACRQRSLTLRKELSSP